MFSRRHYRIIAQVIADLSLSDDEHDNLGLIELDALRESVARQFADALATGNPNFNRVKFLAACRPDGAKPPKAGKRVFDVECPRCGKHGEIVCSEANPRVSCGDCLVNDVEIVTMRAVERVATCAKETHRGT